LLLDLGLVAWHHNEMIDSQYLLAIDLEATCDATQLPIAEREIIEIGAVVIERDSYRKMAEFQSFVRPVKTEKLTDYCRKLTSIDQGDVDSAPLFPAVLDAFNQFLQPYSDLMFCAWGDYDYRQFRRDCATYDVDCPFEQQVDISKTFRRFMKLDRRPSLKDAARLMSLDFNGTQHRAIDDARCLADILVRFIPAVESQEKPK
jgi:inhibitor of KinA sporulation pathway (predicted exonuclease)